MSPTPPLPALVVGGVRHERHAPIRHAFRNRHYQWLVDLDSVPRLPAPLARLTALRPEDHLDGPKDFSRLKEAVRQRIRDHGIELPADTRVVMLAHARVLGHVFDPLSVFWCLGPDGRVLAAVLEVRNTYAGRHVYVLQPDDDGRAEVDKVFLVSPFNDVSGRYAVRLRLDAARVAVSIRLEREGRTWLTASTWGRPVPLTPRSVAVALATHPFMTQRVSALIRVHGVWLWARRLPVLRGVTADPGARHGLAAPGRHTRVTRGRVARALVERLVRGMPVRLLYPDGRTVGGGDAGSPVLELRAPRRVFERLETHPKIGLGESYMAGEWAAAPGTDLGALLTPFAARVQRLVPRPLLALRGVLDRALPHHQRNTVTNARSNISAHYDLGNDLFAAFLDETMTYSSALFDRHRPLDGQDLAQAQRRKIDTALDAAGVGEGTRLLEIGTGWGELALRAAARGAQVTTITLSEEQLRLAEKRMAEAGVADRVEVALCDYREVEGEFDAVVSIEMIEAVGEEFWPDYVRAVDRRLSPGGTAVVQAILMDHDRMLATRNSFGWIQKHVFPGGLIPSLPALTEVTERHTALRIREVRAFGTDYAETLRRWRERFEAAWPELTRAGYDEVFRRRWEFYLAYCEAGFASGYLDVAQLTLRRST